MKNPLTAVRQLLGGLENEVKELREAKRSSVNAHGLRGTYLG